MYIMILVIFIIRMMYIINSLITFTIYNFYVYEYSSLCENINFVKKNSC